ncbi:MAG: agmatine deiminase family protein [Prevotella sp.]|nr:agmatine deiminase family protein [Prevotella sp.]
MINSDISRFKNVVLSLFLSLILTTPLYAQDSSEELAAYPQTLHHILHKRTYNGEYPLPELPFASETLQTSGAKDAVGQSLNFPDRVWFPGEWEEVKAIVLTANYYHFVPDHMNDLNYEAEPLVPGYAAYYYYPSGSTKPEIIGYGPYKTVLDVKSDSGKVFLYLMDGVQRGSAEAWVRIEKASDEQVIRQAMQGMGLRTDKMRFFVANGNCFWFRDCGPICFYYGDDDNLAMLDFQYKPTRALDNLLPSVLHRKMGIPNYITDIIWEGGNCLVDGVGGLITSSAVYANNADTVGRVAWDGANYSSVSFTKKAALTAEDVKSAFYDLVGHRSVYVLNRLNHDGGTGHVDLYADAINENGLIFTGMPQQYNMWSDYDVANMNISYMLLQNSFWSRRYYDMGSVPFPSKDDGSPFKSEMEYRERYTRSYANHAIVNNVILQPCFSKVGADGMPTAAWDRANIEALKKIYLGYKFYCVDMRTLDSMGGSIHCVTKQIPADNPIRFLHKNIHDSVSVGQLKEIPFSTIITNKSGIQSTQLIYRVGEGAWQTLNLTADGNCWSGSVPVSQLGKEQRIDYYFKATSNNGKTSTKPLTADNGGYFNFTLTDRVEYDETMFDFSTAPMPKDQITFRLGTSWLTEDTSTDTSTGISEVMSYGKADKTVKDGWYTLNGLRLSTQPTAKGIYICNGKKVVIGE